MPAALPYSKQTPGRTFIIAISVLGLVALTQIGALGIAFVKRVKNGPPASTLPASNLALARPKLTPATAEESESLSLEDPFADSAAKVASEKDTGPIMPPAKPQPVPLARLQPAPDTRFGELLQQGKTLRERGDASNALIKFREAYALDPRNPAAIAEIAQTFEKMGLPDKAAEHWKRIFDMGESAGIYYAAAEAKMKEAMMTAQVALGSDPNAQGGSGVVANATLGIGTVETEEINDPKAMRRFLLKVPIQLRQKTRLNVKDVAIQVLFYDLVDDKPQRTSANVSNRFSTAPVDWREDNTEILEVEYNQPAPDPRDPKPENRKYFGYIIRLYYNDELQATRAEPPLLGQKFPASHTLEKEVAQ
jgi:tetratricopeptide (TPR) repeat protein